MVRNKSIGLLLIVLFLWGCSNTRYLKEGELLYTGASVTVKDSTLSKKERKALKSRMEALTRPLPNKKFLGLRPKLYIYNLAGEPKSDKGLRHWLRTKVGEPPVLFQKVKLDYNAELIQNNAQNLGYFKAVASADSTRYGKKASAEYTLYPSHRYTIKSVTFPIDSTRKVLDSTIASFASQSLLRLGEGYDLDIIKNERIRIDNKLKENGYYFFSPDFIKVQVDSTVGKQEVDLIVKVKDQTPADALKVYRINDIFIYPSFTVRRDTVGIDSPHVTYYKDYIIIDKQNRFKPRIFDRALYFEKGDVYNRADHNLSLNRLVSLGVFKFVKNQFRVLEEDDNLLDAFYYLTPLTNKSIRVETLGKMNSANYYGSEINVNWSHRNAFKGAELLQARVFGGLEVQVSGQNKGFNVYRVGGDLSLTWPRFLTPFTVHSASGFMPRTKASLGYEYQMRSQLYSLNRFNASFGYLWKENIRKEHQYNVTEITYVNPGFVTDLYQNRIDNDPTGSLKKVVERQLIFGPTYSYTYTNTMLAEKKHTYYFKGGLDIAGTIAGLATGADVRSDNERYLFDVPFSQYVRAETEFRHYWKLSPNSQLASRAIAGLGYAYGNSKEMPFVKQFFIGGTNSIRAFRARSLGPGTYKENVGSGEFLADQSGDIKIELNTELRTKIYSLVHGALFIDAGNIWLREKQESRPGAEFSGRFLEEMAIGTGAGIRLDLSFLIVRLDLAFPLRKPWLEENRRWVLDQIEIGDPTWRRENLILNLAIGYPF